MSTFGTGLFGDGVFGGDGGGGGGASDMPAVTTRVAFSTQPLAGPTWTEISERLRAFTIERGRGSELEEFQAGTSTLTAKNNDRALDPANTSSPYYGNLKPRKRVQQIANWGGVFYDLFDGHVKRWPQSWQTTIGTCELPCSDAFEIFQSEIVSTTDLGDGTREVRAEERSDQRLGWVLDQIGWPAARRIFNTGEVAIQPFAYEAVNALGHMRQIEQAEKGFLFMDAAGNVVLQDKFKRMRDYSVSQATFGDGAGELPFSDPDFDLDVDHIVNHATGKLANSDDGRVFEYSDAASRGDYGPSAKTIELWSASATEPEARAHHLVTRYAQPLYRIKAITILPQKSPTLLWPQALGRVIGERITVKARFYGVGPLLTHEARIEGIRHDVTPAVWKTTFRLSPVFAQELQGYWRLGTAGKSELNLTTRLAA